MIAACTVAGLAVTGMLGLALYLIVADILNPTALFSGLGTLIALILILPLAVPPLVSTIMLVRQRSAKLLHTVCSGVTVLIWLYELISFGPDREPPLLLTPAAVLLVISVVLIWLPASQGFFQSKEAEVQMAE